MDASDRSEGCAPLAALLHPDAALPAASDIVARSDAGSAFALSHVADVADGWAEILCDGLTFDLHGLAGGPSQPMPEIGTGVGIAPAALAGMAALTLAPGPHLAGAQRLLPVIRVLAHLLVELARIGPASAIAWLPARLSIRSDLFERAVRPWLDGGPFPAPAFVALHATAAGELRSEGLNFLTGQEFVLRSTSPEGAQQLSRVAMRLVDWLVAHGPISTSTDAVLAGTGAVFLEVRDHGRILARCD